MSDTKQAGLIRRKKKIFLKDCCKRNRVQCRQYFHGDVFVKTAMNQAVAG
jgi:hypothetical protein